MTWIWEWFLEHDAKSKDRQIGMVFSLINWLKSHKLNEEYTWQVVCILNIHWKTCNSSTKWNNSLLKWAKGMKRHHSKIIHNCQDARETVLSISEQDRMRMETSVNYHFMWMAAVRTRRWENAQLGPCACVAVSGKWCNCCGISKAVPQKNLHVSLPRDWALAMYIQKIQKQVSKRSIALIRAGPVTLSRDGSSPTVYQWMTG